MTKVTVQFTDATETTVAAVFGCAQDPVAFPHQAEVDDTDARYLAFVDPAATLPGAQAAQMAAMGAAYQSAIAAGVTFMTAAGVTKAFQSDAQSVANAQAMLTAYKTAVPTGFYWVSADDTQVPFTLADLQGLAKTMGDLGWSCFQQLQQRKASIKAATTIAAVQAVTW